MLFNKDETYCEPNEPDKLIKPHSDTVVGLEVLQIIVIFPGSVRWTHLNTETSQKKKCHTTIGTIAIIIITSLPIGSERINE